MRRFLFDCLINDFLYNIMSKPILYRIHLCIRACMCVCMYTCLYACMYAYTCMYVVLSENSSAIAVWGTFILGDKLLVLRGNLLQKYDRRHWRAGNSGRGYAKCKTGSSEVDRLLEAVLRLIHFLRQCWGWYTSPTCHLVEEVLIWKTGIVHVHVDVCFNTLLFSVDRMIENALNSVIGRNLRWHHPLELLQANPFAKDRSIRSINFLS